MSTRIKLAALAVGLAGALTAAPAPVHAAVWFSAGLEINSPGDFYSPLAPYGVWETVVPYGRCWHPLNVERDWRPYGIGYWEWTDCGWYWASDEPWAWACYHYGSWVYDSFYGWVWVPAVEWAPAWVVWRESPEYIGWAPCGPSGFSVAPAEFAFVDVHHFHDRMRPGVFVVNDPVIIQSTRFVNNISRTTRDFDGVSRRVVVNRGPDPSVIQRATGTRFTARPIREVVSHTPAPASVPRTRSGVVVNRPALSAPANMRQQPTSVNSAQEAQRRERRNGQEAPRAYPQNPTGTVAPQTPRPDYRTPSPTGREPRYSTPPTTAPEPRQREYRTQPSQGREAPPVYRQAPPAQGAASAPDVPRRQLQAPPATGREMPRTYPPTPSRPNAEPPARAPAGPREAVPPAGREAPQAPPSFTPPPVPPPGAAARPVAPPGQERRRDRERDQ